MRKTMMAASAALLVMGGAQLWGAEGSDRWEDWAFLIGTWTAEGSGRPGEAVGGFTFERDLGGRILIRRNRAEYPASDERRGSSHEDLMIVYKDPAGPLTRAVYFDSKGHVIHYTVEFSGDKKTLTFLSENKPPMPRFRLTYTRTDDHTVSITFEMAPPGTDKFSVYTKGTAKRRS